MELRFIVVILCFIFDIVLGYILFYFIVVLIFYFLFILVIKINFINKSRGRNLFEKCFKSYLFFGSFWFFMDGFLR